MSALLDGTAILPPYRGEFGPDDGPRKVLVSPLVMEQMAEAALRNSGRTVSIDWGEPDADGFYTPTITTHEETP